MAQPPSTSSGSIGLADIIPVFGCLIVLIILALFLFLPPPQGAYIRPLATPFAIAVTVPCIVTMALLLTPRPRIAYTGLTLAASFAIIAFVPALVVMVASSFIRFFGILFLVRTQYFAIPGTVAMLLVTALVAKRAATKVPVSARADRAWPLALGIAAVYALVMFGGFSMAFARTNARESAKLQSQWHMFETIPTLKKCLGDYAKAHPDRGYPASLKDLAAGPTPCLDAAIASGEAGGFRYEYLPLLPDDSGVVREFTACVRPGESLSPPAPTVTFDDRDTRGHGKTLHRFIIETCPSTWGMEYLQVIKFCAARFAAAHPDRGYPATLAEVGPSGDGCIVSDTDPFQISLDRDILMTNFGRFAYKAGPRDATGRIRRYEAVRADLPLGSGMQTLPPTQSP